MDPALTADEHAALPGRWAALWATPEAARTAFLIGQPRSEQVHLLLALWTHLLKRPTLDQMHHWHAQVAAVWPSEDPGFFPAMGPRYGWQDLQAAALKRAVAARWVPAIRHQVDVLVTGPTIGNHRGDWFDLLYPCHRDGDEDLLRAMWHQCTPAERQEVLLRAVQEHQGEYLAHLVRAHPGDLPADTWALLGAWYRPQDAVNAFPRQAPAMLTVLAPHTPLITLAEAAAVFLTPSETTSAPQQARQAAMAHTLLAVVAQRLLPGQADLQATFCRVCRNADDKNLRALPDRLPVEHALVRWAQACTARTTSSLGHAWVRQVIERLGPPAGARPAVPQPPSPIACIRRLSRGRLTP